MARDAQTRTVICLTGPESTGKSTLALGLAQHLGALHVTEAARRLLESREPGDYDATDVLDIARTQLADERAALATDAPIVVLDTDLSVIKIWYEERFARSDSWLDAAWRDLSPRHYLLLAPDLAWRADPLRENPLDRPRLFDRYKALLDTSRRPYEIVYGEGPARLDAALAIVRLLPGIALRT